MPRTVQSVRAQQALVKELPGLIEKGFPTPMQREKLEACMNHGGNMSQAARSLNISRAAIRQAIDAVRERAQMQGWSPEHDMTRTAPETHLVKGVSTLYNQEGEVAAQWVKTQLKAEDKLKQIKKFAEELALDLTGKAKKTKAPKTKKSDVLTMYPEGDPHLGRYSWGEEAGEDFDTNIAVSDLRSAAGRLVDVSPPSEVGILINLGDFFETDTNDNRTLRSGNVLDVDTRWARVMRMGAAVMKEKITLMLEKHQKVILRNVIGNHDDHTSQALSLVLDAYYSKEPRVEIITSPSPFWYYRFGKNLIGTTHGHTVKPNDLANIMAHDRPEDWGQTLFRYWLLGHIHHQKVHEVGSVVIEYFRTLAAKNEWENAQGYRSGRDMNSIVLHREFGQIERHRADILMVRS